MIAGVVVDGAVGFIGLVFLGVWLLIAYLRTEVLRRERRACCQANNARPTSRSRAPD